MKTWFRTLLASAFVSLASVSPAQVFGPTPYLSAADSPFQSGSFPGYFHRDDMEDGLLDTPGVSCNRGFVFGPGSSNDSVDADDGSIDGSGTLGKSYLVAGIGNPTGLFTFDAQPLGRLPSHAGIVVTDAHDPVFVEGIALNGASLGIVTITGYGPPPDTQGQTAEDRFVGFVFLAGIRELRVSTLGGGGIEIDHIQYGSVDPPIQPFCPGDGSGTACPCNNTGSTGNGCGNSVNPAGATLSSNGIASISNDTAVLTGSGMTNNSVLYYQGTTQLNGGSGTAFGDGIRCAGGNLTRLGTRTNTGGSSSFPPPGGPSLSTQGNASAGQALKYQCWYRDSATFCTSDTYSMTNALQIVWVP